MKNHQPLAAGIVRRPKAPTLAQFELWMRNTSKAELQKMECMIDDNDSDSPEFADAYSVFDMCDKGLAALNEFRKAAAGGAA